MGSGAAAQHAGGVWLQRKDTARKLSWRARQSGDMMPEWAAAAR